MNTSELEHVTPSLQYSKFFDMCDSILEDISEVLGQSMSLPVISLAQQCMNTVKENIQNSGQDVKASLLDALMKRLLCIVKSKLDAVRALPQALRNFQIHFFSSYLRHIFTSVEKFLLPTKLTSVPNLNQIIWLEILAQELEKIAQEKNIVDLSENTQETSRAVIDADKVAFTAELSSIKSLLAIHMLNSSQIIELINAKKYAEANEKSIQLYQNFACVDVKMLILLMKYRSLHLEDEQVSHFLKK
ncbi:hypothetical protein RFI_29386 [Reticulomyxa filosa]|uniref:Uncharacterized protein n=1 Tax=Reticulomyxa filosa TaxID=46433 RepID=X6M2A4_RETFI|nr:hypothetical protein RFI_29386 [Reticulomyxa filosa]|eukprot:ETO08004.1 hypothetical protein RFI_29386 [Reticulomyxa filosa]